MINEELRKHEKLWRRGMISFNEYKEKTNEMVREEYSSLCSLEYEREQEPQGISGFFLRVIKKIF
tara:strand:+ start:112 stop:306 length:195 start_codon:yes stop_codon:yes gene_type:complete